MVLFSGGDAPGSDGVHDFGPSTERSSFHAAEWKRECVIGEMRFYYMQSGHLLLYLGEATSPMSRLMELWTADPWMRMSSLPTLLERQLLSLESEEEAWRRGL